jgi:transcriptional regulator with XRE-family HTH domain
MTVGQRIRKIRKEKDWTQRDLGQRTGIDHRNLTRYETGAVKPSIKVLERIASAFEISVDELIHDPSEIRPELLIQDKELLRQFQEVEKLEESEKQAVKIILEALITRKQMQGLLSSKISTMEKKAS